MKYPETEDGKLRLCFTSCRGSCLQPRYAHSILFGHQANGECNVVRFADPASTAVILVSRADTSALREAERSLLLRLRDAEYTRVLIVTLPEATPVHEAERLQADLARGVWRN